MEENLPVILVSVLVVVIISISVVFLRMCIYNCLGRKKTPTSTQWALTISRPNNQVSATLSEWTPDLTSDHQIVFERVPSPLRNIPRLNAATSATQIVQQLDEQFHLDHLEMEHERRARERREALERNMNHLDMPRQIADYVPDYISVISVERRTENYPNAPPTREHLQIVENNYSSLNPAPLYISQDDELPSYEEAVTKNNGTSV